MRRALPLILLAAAAFGQTPTFVQGVSCVQSLNSQIAAGTTTDYICPIGEKTLANNLVVVGTIYDNTNSPTLTVTLTNASGTTVDTMTQIVTNTTANGNVQRIYAVQTAGGAEKIKLHMTTASDTVGYVDAVMGEWYNATTTTSGTAGCTRVSATSVAAGNITVASGGLLVQTMFQDDTTASGALTAGSGFSFVSTDRNDSAAMQWRTGNGSAINPTITQGTSHPTATCKAGFTASAVGTAPSASFRRTHLAHVNMDAAAANPYVIQVPIEGNLAVIGFHGGGDTVTGITDSGSNTWTCTTNTVNGLNSDAICYAPITSPSNAMAISITRSGTTTDGTFMTSDLTGADSSPFDTSQTMSGTNGTLSSSFTTCSSCFTPGATNEIIFANAGWDYCTATASPTPSGSIFGAATYSANHIDGPQRVDQNNGWLMYRNGASTSAFSVTWTMDCTGTGGASIGQWSGTMASFKQASGGGGGIRTCRFGLMGVGGC